MWDRNARGAVYEFYVANHELPFYVENLPHPQKILYDLTFFCIFMWNEITEKYVEACTRKCIKNWLKA